MPIDIIKPFLEILDKAGKPTIGVRPPAALTKDAPLALLRKEMAWRDRLSAECLSRAGQLGLLLNEVIPTKAAKKTICG